MPDGKMDTLPNGESASDTNDEPVTIRERETWGRKFDFLLACIGFSVGLGNVWRFPYLCYKNGGGAFLIPYLLFVIIGGIPLFYLEVAVGQFMSVSGLGAWNICPLFQGIGISVTIIVFLLNCYYNVILAWAFYYMFASFTSQLPWTTCDNAWNTINCVVDLKMNGTNVTVISGVRSDPVTEYWERKVLGISSGIHEMGTIKWDLALCLLLAWIVVYLCICKGIKSSGKVMYVTATSPYIFMTILLVNGLLLPGALDGVIFYLKPDFSKLLDMQVWVDAGTQIFFSYSISIGALTALGSYNKFNHNSYRDSIIFACANSGTSLFAGFIIFPVLGNMALEQGKDISEVAESGPGLAFIAYPKAVSNLPVAPLWSFFFFLMIILLGLDSQFVGVEGVITAVVDQWPGYLRVGRRREVFIGIVCAISFFVGLSMVTNGGMYVFQLFDYYSGSRIILLVAFFECVAVAWCYGVRRFYDNLEMMMGFRINPYMLICWTVLSPIFCLAVFVMSAINYSELTYERPIGTYVYPTWAVAIGWTMASFSAMWIPIVMVYKLIKYYLRYRDPIKILKLIIKPYGLKEHQLRPQDVGESTLQDLENNQLSQRYTGPQPKVIPLSHYPYVPDLSTAAPPYSDVMRSQGPDGITNQSYITDDSNTKV